MAKHYNDHRSEATKVFDDLDAYHDYCRFELCEFNPADLYRKDSANYQAYLANKRGGRRFNNNGHRNFKPRYNEQNFSR
jgi:hypothetical protein